MAGICRLELVSVVSEAAVQPVGNLLEIDVDSAGRWIAHCRRVAGYLDLLVQLRH